MPEGSTAPENIKLSKNPLNQEKVETYQNIILEKHPTASVNLANEQARSRVAAELRIGRLKKEVERNKGKAIKDQLTGALNGNGFEEIMQLEGRRTLRSRKPMVIAVLDANDLKKYNEEGGHDAGDVFLKKIAEVLQKTSRASDILGRKRNSDEPDDQDRVARWGGDEFGVILEETDIEGAKTWWTRTAAEFEAVGISIGAGMQVLNPEDIEGKTPGEISAIIADKKHEADMAMMGVAKAASKAENKPALTVYNEIPDEQRANLPQRIREMRQAA